MPFSSETIVAGPYTPNGVTTTFAYSFRGLSEDEIEVVVVDGSGVETVLSGYDTPGLPSDGGNVVFAVAPSYVGQSLYVRAKPRLTQELDFENQGDFSPSVLNEAFDRAAMQVLWIKLQLDAL